MSSTNPFSLGDDEEEEEENKKGQPKDFCERNVKCNLPVVVPCEKNPFQSDDLDLGTMPGPTIIKRLHDDGKVIRHDALKGRILVRKETIGEMYLNEKAMMMYMTNPTTLSAYTYRITLKNSAMKKLQSRALGFSTVDKENLYYCSKSGNLVYVDCRLNETQRVPTAEAKEDNEGIYWASDIHAGYILLPSGASNLVFLRLKDRRKKTLKEVCSANERIRRATYCVVTKRLLLMVSSKTQEIKHLRVVDFLEKKKHVSEFDVAAHTLGKHCSFVLN